ncbi:DUF1985 domain-containing protein [Abeliophyllum distichum]|uniref:DUF1985 domain-containing protein n=1 Tax=Abeliophyllum distichum TaxID=126358 RepID=A0ABD1VWN0_9LAMI
MEKKVVNGSSLRMRILFDVRRRDWELLIIPVQWCLGKVNAFSRNDVISTLRGRMSDVQRKMFSESCFGHFLEMNEIVLNHQLMHQVLLREVKQPNVDEMWFNLSGSLLSDREVFKCCLLLLLTNLFFTTAYKRSVEDSLMVLVDSDDMNTFAWGKDLFKFTLSSLISGLRNKSLIVEGDGKPYIA